MTYNNVVSIYKTILSAFEKYNCDLVIGARDLLSGNIEGLSLSRQIQSKICIKIVDMLLKRKTVDPMSGYFIFNKKIFTKNKRRMFILGYKILSDLIYSSKNMIKIKDIPIVFDRRISGKSKMSFSILIKLLLFIFVNFFKKIGS